MSPVPFKGEMGALLFWCGLMIAVIPHELGHAAAAKLVGIRIRGIDMGTGPLLLRVRLRHGGWLLIRSVLLGGSLRYTRPIHPRRLAEAVVLLGGPAANITLFFPLAIASDKGWLSPTVMQPFAFAQLLAAALNLVPFSFWQVGRRIQSDGAQLLGLLRPRKVSIAEGLLTMVRPLVPDATLGDLSDQTPMLAQLVAELLTEQEDWARRDTAASLSASLSGALTVAERTLVLSVLADTEIRRGGTGADWDDPERWTRCLLQISTTPITQLLRGAALVRSGSSVDGRKFLTMALSQDLDFASATNFCICAACAARSGDDPLAAELARRRAEEVAERQSTTFDAATFQAMVDVAPVKPRHSPLRYPASKLTRLGLAAVIALAAGLSAVVAGNLAYYSGERRGYLAACDERAAARVISWVRPNGVRCGQ